MSLSGRQYVIEAGRHRATIVEVGAGLQGYTCDGVDVTSTYGDDTLPPRGCGSTLVPWPNRIRDGRYTFDGTSYELALTEPEAHHAIHGLGRWARWTKVRQVRESVTLRLDIVPQTGYPFEVRVEKTYALDSEDGLVVTMEARNCGGVRAPFGAGSHPYLSTRGHPLTDTTVQVPAGEWLVLDERQIPVGTHRVTGTEHDLRRGRRLGPLRFDDGFTSLATRDGRGVAEVRTPSGGARLWFDETYRYLQVFTYEPLGGVAVEPMTCAPDAFNSGAGLMVLEPGETWSGTWGITPLTGRSR